MTTLDTNKQLFLFAAKVGSLEGYLYKRDKLDMLDDWVSNIINLYHGLPSQMGNDIRVDLRVVLARILTYGAETMDTKLKTKIGELLREVD